MKKYLLVHENGEIIKGIAAGDKRLALDYFSTLKQLPVDKLLEIYNVIESKERNTRSI